LRLFQAATILDVAGGMPAPVPGIGGVAVGCRTQSSTEMRTR
jgi:hypothetical protein